MKKYMIIFAILAVTGLFLPISLAGSGQVPTKSETIVIFHMNDIHAQIDNFARIAPVIEKERKKFPNVFFMVAGDNFSGNPVVDRYNPRGEPIMQLLNRLKVNALTLGNHEFDYGQEILKEHMEKAKYPVICANVKVIPGGDAVIPQPKPFITLKTKKGTGIAILGLIQISKGTNIPSTHPDRLKGLVFSDGVETAKQYRYLKKDNNLFIALSHLGYDDDEILANQMGDLDLIIGGHSHTIIKEPKEVNGVLITQAGSNARFLGRIEIKLENGRIISKKGKLIDVATLTCEDPEIKRIIAEFNDNPELNRIIATLPMELTGSDQLGNLITDAVRKMNRLDMVFHNQGGIRLDRMGPKVLLKNIYRMLPFENDVVIFEMTPAEIKSLIANSYRRQNELDLKVSGIQYTVIVQENAGPGKPLVIKDVELKDEAGNLLDENKKYKVGINDYIASSYKFTHKDQGKALKTLIASVVIDYLQSGNINQNLKQIRTHEKKVN
ncbi:MAG: bifunctional metallophosphatase/5'-nucleotidase [Acidobacteria bacterium]|jgi:2',3'-cyclic-nucleotide 2'-phosphodiesterase (5'-nucleotidase family)|nr:bifunctional metallophosphatase/5'-nucleotidase [Acidobacteriota bacterium]